MSSVIYHLVFIWSALLRDSGGNKIVLCFHFKGKQSSNFLLVLQHVGHVVAWLFLQFRSYFEYKKKVNDSDALFSLILFV